MFPADVIPLQYQALLLVDECRMTAFENAIARTVTPGLRVLDLGAGTGVLSYFAARQGARVTAVEWEPRVFETARSSLRAALGDQVRTVNADARDYLPDGPVDLVMCEMLHVGLLRERQIEVIDGFKSRYPGPMPRFLPAACVQAAQPVQHDFTYSGYTVAAPVFQHPDHRQPRTVEIAPPEVFQQFFYSDPLPSSCDADLRFTATVAATVNGVRVITKNLLTAGVDWLMNYLVVPLPEPVTVGPGDEIHVCFSYCPGDEISALTDGLSARVSVGRRRLFSIVPPPAEIESEAV